MTDFDTLGYRKSSRRDSRQYDYEDTVEVIGRSPKGIDALKRTQSAYLTTLVKSSYGPEYFRERACIGKLHDMLDMPMKQ